MAVDTLARAIAAGKVPVDAYEMAVAGGYTGTKEEFEADMGNSGTNATNAANSAAAAAASETAALAAATNFAPAYSASSTYAVGDYVLYEGGLYECNTAITTAEAWTAAHWTAKKLAPEVAELKTQLNTVCIDKDSIDFSKATVINGMVNSSNLWSTTSGYKSYKFDRDDKAFKVKISANSNAYAVISFLQTDSLSHAQTPPFCTGTDRNSIDAGSTQEFDIPDDCNYIVVTKESSSTIYTPSAMEFYLYKYIPNIDDTLSVSGEAADAKAVGDRTAGLIYTKQIDFTEEVVYNYIISTSSPVLWVGSGDRYCYIVKTPDNAKTLTITANANYDTQYALLKSSAHQHNTAPDFCVGISSSASVSANTTGIIALPSDCEYVYIRKSYDNDNDRTPTSAVFTGLCNVSEIQEQTAENTIRLEGIAATPSQIFNIDLAATDGTDLTGYSDDYQGANGYTPPTGWENRITINKYVVCDDIKYRANISLGTAGTGVCVLGTETLAGSAANHATLVKFDFGNALVSFLTGSDEEGGANIDGTSIPAYTYDSFALTNLSGTEYRIEIGREKRAPYAKVYNLTTGVLCGEKSLATVYETSAGYGGKAGAMYDLPNFGVTSGTVTFRRVSASVPCGVFAAFLGDSITEGSKCAWADVWANKSILYLGNGVNCGRGSGAINHMLRCATDILPAVKPKYVFVTIGTNGTPTLAQFKNLIDLIKNINAIPVVNHIPMNNKSGSGSTSEVNAVVDTLGLDSIRFDVATAVNNDPAQGQNTSLFNADGLHPNSAGGAAMYNQFIADMGWIKPDEWDAT